MDIEVEGSDLLYCTIIEIMHNTIQTKIMLWGIRNRSSPTNTKCIDNIANCIGNFQELLRCSQITSRHREFWWIQWSTTSHTLATNPPILLLKIQYQNIFWNGLDCSKQGYQKIFKNEYKLRIMIDWIVLLIDVG